MLSNTLVVNFRYRKIVHIFHPHYHQKFNRTYSKNMQKKQVRINHNENEDEKEKEITYMRHI